MSAEFYTETSSQVMFCSMPTVSHTWPTLVWRAWLKLRLPVTRTLEVLGTPSYIAPEQAAGNTARITSATDVYGLGAVFYQLLTGHPPFAGGTTYETIRLVLETEAAKSTSLECKGGSRSGDDLPEMHGEGSGSVVIRRPLLWRKISNGGCGISRFRHGAPESIARGRQMDAS